MAFLKLYTTEHVFFRVTPNIWDSSVKLSFPPSMEEVQGALFSMKPLKAPGPDGFHPIFFQNKWGVVKDEIFKEIGSWFAKGKIPENLSHALICLIPSKPVLKQLNTFDQLVFVIPCINSSLKFWLTESSLSSRTGFHTTKIALSKGGDRRLT